MAFAFEKLLVYQRAVDLADGVAASGGLSCGDWLLADPLNRAALSTVPRGTGIRRFAEPRRANDIAEPVAPPQAGASTVSNRALIADHGRLAWSPARPAAGPSVAAGGPVNTE